MREHAGTTRGWWALAVALVLVVLSGCTGGGAPVATSPPANPAAQLGSPVGTGSGSPVPSVAAVGTGSGQAGSQVGASPNGVASPSAVGSPSAAVPSGRTADPALASVWAGKTVTLIVSQAPGGGYDNWARLVGRHYGRHLPGNPSIVVQNMTGGDHRIATNAIYEARPDGLTLGLVGRQIPNVALRNEGPAEGTRFDVRKINWLGSTTVDTQVLLVDRRAGVTGARQLESKEIRLGNTTPGTPPHSYLAVLREGLGWKLRPTFGYQGTAAIGLAIQRGEVDGEITDWDSAFLQHQDRLRAKELIPLVQLGEPKPDVMLAGVPLATELFRSLRTETRQLLGLVQIPFAWSRPFMTGPNVDPKVVAGMRAAFMATMEDPAFREDAEKLGFDLSPISGERVQVLIEEYLQTPASVIEKLDAIINQDNPV